jgi:recombination protein RecR
MSSATRAFRPGNSSLTTVVEMPVDSTPCQTHAFNGLYYVLMDGCRRSMARSPELAFDRLLARANSAVREVVLATNFTNEGEATAHYIAEMLRARGLKVSRIARGLPVGGELEYSDAATVAQAFIERRDY